MMTQPVIPRAEYPRPQFVRADWLCLNGEWEFEIDQGDSGLERGLLQKPLSDRITVPFCPESKLSGVDNQDFLNAVWYRKTVTIPAEWSGKRILLHFGAVDYDTTVWVNGTEVRRHRGGFTSFSCDLNRLASGGDEITIVVRARDTRFLPQPRGKQSQDYAPDAALYWRTTGIWQSVWLEPVPDAALKRPRITPDLANSAFHIQQAVTHSSAGMRVRVILKQGDEEVTRAETSIGYDFAPQLTLAIPEGERRVWSIQDPFLYDLEIALLGADGQVIDSAQSYAGLRGVSLDGKAVKINGEVVFQRLVLDQGFYPDGLLTAPSDADLIRDIELSQAAGFNGARLHQKVFEERFLYHADRMGYIVWGEFGDWGCRVPSQSDKDHQQPTASYITQWLEALERDYSHPSIVGWCPLNETWQTISDQITVLDDVTQGMFLATKAMDLTRPVLDTSGYSHRVYDSDIYDNHDYDQKPETFAVRHAGLAEDKPFLNGPDQRNPRNAGLAFSLPYDGQPFFVSEFGGIWWNPNLAQGEASWGYGDRPTDIEAFYQRFEGLCSILLDNPLMFGYCYTQLTDVFQEQNGIYTFQRGEKFDMERIRRVQQRRAAIES